MLDNISGGVDTNDREITRKALLYELRLFFVTNEKEQYSVDEICEILDKIAMSKEQEK